MTTKTKTKTKTKKVKEAQYEYKSKTLHYRFAEIRNYQGDASLAELVNKALTSLYLVKNRCQIINEDSHDPDEEEFRKSRLFINNKASHWNILFGDLIKYSDGTNKSILTIVDSANFLEIEPLAPPENESGQRREFLDSILYFGIFKNHLAIIQSAVLRTTELERHINWLLKEANVVEPDVYVLLTAKIPENTQKVIERSPTKTLEIGAPLVDMIGNRPVDKIKENFKELKKTNSKKISIKPKGLGLNWLLNAFGDMKKLEEFGITEDLLVEDALSGSSLDVYLKIIYTGKTSKQSQAIINNVSTAMRHSHPDDIKVNYGNGGRLIGRDLVLQKAITVRYFKGVLDAQDLFPKIKDWLIEQISIDEIDVENT